jgi:hypothetical protein
MIGDSGHGRGIGRRRSRVRMGDDSLVLGFLD